MLFIQLLFYLKNLTYLGTALLRHLISLDMALARHLMNLSTAVVRLRIKLDKNLVRFLSKIYTYYGLTKFSKVGQPGWIFCGTFKLRGQFKTVIEAVLFLHLIR